LFWKFFLSIWLAQAAAVLAISSGIWLKGCHEARKTGSVDASPATGFQLDSAAATLEHGGRDALRALLRKTAYRPLFAIDQDNHDVLDRALNPAVVEQARQLMRQDEHFPAVRRVTTAGGQTYLLFMPRMAREPGAGPMRGPPPPPDWQPRPVHFPVMPMLYAMIASLVSAALLAWHFAKPIRSLRMAFESASTGDLEPRVGVAMGRRHDELADLGRDFDRMAARLQSLMDGQRRLLHDVSHEMRSPLARLQAAIGLARQRPERIESSLERIERESVRIDELVGELLTLSRLDAGVVGDMSREINIGEVVAEVVDDARFEADAQDKKVGLQDNCMATVRGNAELLHRAFENVVRNALKYTGKGGHVDVKVALEEASPHVLVTICDQGPGVPEQEMPLIFEPFYRGDSARSKTGGHGLGLAIAKRTVEAHRGSIRAMNLDSRGLCVQIRLPILGAAKRQETSQRH